MAVSKTPPPSLLGSEEIVAELAREAQVLQLGAIDSLDTKAAQLIGFTGIVFGLVFTSSAAQEDWNWGLSVGAGLLALAAVGFGVALLPRDYKLNPNIPALERGYLHAPPRETAAVVVESIGRALAWNTDVLRWKVRFVRLATTAALLGMLVTGGGLLYAVICGR